jgi:hypothetical protein
MKYLILLLCFIPSLAFAETKIKFRDGSAMCGDGYVDKGDKYCKSIGGGESCFDKAEIVSVTAIEDCSVLIGQGQNNLPTVSDNVTVAAMKQQQQQEQAQIDNSSHSYSNPTANAGAGLAPHPHGANTSTHTDPHPFMGGSR